MAAGNESSLGKEMVVVEKEKEEFPAGLRVLAVDDDRVYLMVLEALLHHCKYQPTMVQDGATALRTLQDGREQFDLVISDVHMPDMDGFTLLELIGLKMDIPVIMLSANDDKDAVYKGIESGACDYLIKPVNVKELGNIWQHVVRRRIPKPSPQVLPTNISEGNAGSADPLLNYTGRNDISGDKLGPREIKENKTLPWKKKPRVSWTRELHGKFLQVVNRIGADKAVPKKIWEMMNVSHISRESVASHLQKYRLYIKRLDGFGERRSYSLCDSGERWSSYPTMDDPGSHKHHHERPGSASSGDFFPRMGSAVHGDNMVMDTRKFPPSDHGPTMLLDDGDDDDDDDEIPLCSNGNSASILRQKILEASKVVPSRRVDNLRDNMPGDAAMPLPTSKFSVWSTPMPMPVIQSPVQSPRPPNESQMNSQLHDIVGSSSRSWQTMAPTEFPDPCHGGDRECTSLTAYKANIPEINQITSFALSSSEIHALDHQMEELIRDPAPVTGFGENMSFDMVGNEISMDMLGENFAFGGAPSTSFALPDTEMDNFIVPTPMPNVEAEAGVLPVLIEENVGDELDHNHQATDGQLDHNNQVITDQMDYSNQLLDNQMGYTNQALENAPGFDNLDDQMNYSNDFFLGTDDTNMMASLDALAANFPAEEPMQDDVFMDRDWI